MYSVLLLASENAAFKGAKVGGIADVIRDLPAPLYEQGIRADVVMPSYGFLLSQNNAILVAEFPLGYRSNVETIKVYVAPNPTCEKSSCYLLDHPLWHTESGKVYSDSGNRPFADDANKFIFFSKAVAECLLRDIIKRPDCIHLHDWHTAFFLLFSRYQGRYQALNTIDTVLTIHNLAIQGIRPLQDDDSSLQAWCPDLFSALSKKQLTEIIDPRYPDCINPLRVGINLADRVHVVSPTYAKEILHPSDHSNGFFGGEGLEKDLQHRHRQLFGIINGCNYPQQKTPNGLNFMQFVALAEETIIAWQGNKEAVTGQDYIAINRLQTLRESNFEPDFLITSVGRLTDQKMLILRQAGIDNETILDDILDRLAAFSDQALLIMVGSGDPEITAEFRQVASRWHNFIFLNGYAETLPDWLYQHGDLFLMPSSFEPCGISQMLAMRDGQPCLVHGVGGLKDTVEHDKSGFVFYGDTLSEQANNLLSTFDYALQISQSDRWSKIKRSAKARRHSWHRVAKEMKRRLYRLS